LRDPFVTETFLSEHPEALVFDCRWYFDGRSGVEAYESGHIPGASFAHLDDDLSGTAGDGGNNPLPTPEQFTRRAQKLGLHKDSLVVAYDDGGGYIAGRLWWMLDSLGIEAFVLAGGIGSWSGPLETGAHRDRGGGTLVVDAWPPDRFATADEVARGGASTVVIDARSTVPYEGAEGSSPRLGHVPGALSAPAVGNLIDLQPRPADELIKRFAALGVEADTPVINYCGAGVSAGLNLLALRRAGHTNARLYIGSWSHWGSDLNRPAEHGPSPLTAP
jgi:thiosulfate/3-mercaptopyruvate sulfurtransferase